MDEFTRALLDGASALGIAVDSDAAIKMAGYYKLLAEENSKYNLTAITSPEQAAVKHFADSLAPLEYLEAGARFADVGSGAGFPAVPIKIMRNDISAAAIEASAKKCAFIERASGLVSAPVNVVNGRAEELGRRDYRGRFDVVAARAVAGFSMLLELCAPLAADGGLIMLYKSAAEDIGQARNALAVLNLEVERVHEYILDDQDRRVYLIRKHAATPDEYPRMFSAIKKKPL